MSLSPSEGVKKSALQTTRNIASSFQRKANKYKTMSKVSTLSLTVVTVAIPVVIATVTADFWSKLVPSVLAAIAAFAAAFIQLEKPHERWALYRRYQRLTEAEALKYEFNSEPYHDGNVDKIIAMKLAQLQLDVHDEWAGLVPRSSDFKASVTGAEGRG